MSDRTSEIKLKGNMILVFGKNGQVAQALQQDLTSGDPQWPCQFLGSDEANFLHPEAILKVLNTIRPSIVINASAYTLVDKAEAEREAAYRINADTVGKIAQWCAQKNAVFVHFSTDYVFDGSGLDPLVESQATNPVNYYGQTKLDGEKLVQIAGGQYYIFRVSWVYAPWGKNFPKTIVRLAQEREEISIVNDQFGSPTDAREISTFVKAVINTDGTRIKLEPGVYHLSFKPYMTWYEMALETIKEARAQGLPLKVKIVHPITTDKFPTPAKRPANSRLATQFLEVQKLVDQVKVIAKEKNWKFLS